MLSKIPNMLAYESVDCHMPLLQTEFTPPPYPTIKEQKWPSSVHALEGRACVTTSGSVLAIVLWRVNPDSGGGGGPNSWRAMQTRLSGMLSCDAHVPLQRASSHRKAQIDPLRTQHARCCASFQSCQTSAGRNAPGTSAGTGRCRRG